jgi:hypothetical protein
VSRREITFFATAFLPPFILYLLTRGTTWALDTIYTMDSAEMVLAARTLGIDHPPSHPLYLIIAHLFSLFPFGRMDERIIFCSVVAMAIAATFLAQAIRLRTGNDWAGLGAGWAFAFGLVIWFHATIAEVYAVQLAGLSAFYLLAAAWLDGKRPATLFSLCFVLGLTATTNVLLAVLLLPGTLYLIHGSGLLSRRFFPPSVICVGIGFAILGTTPLIYIPIRLLGDGFISDFVYLNGYEPGSLRWYLWYFSAEEFTTTRITSLSLLEIPKLLSAYAGSYIDNHSPIYALLSAVGIVAIFRGLVLHSSSKKEKTKSFRSWLAPAGPTPQLFERTLLIGFLATLAPVLTYEVADREVFFMPSFFHLVALGGFGLWRFMEAIEHATFPEAAKPWLAGILAFVAPAFLALSHYQDVNAITSDTSLYEERETRYLALPDRAIVTSTDDGRATRWKYWQSVQGLRPDVRIETLGRLAPRYQGTGANVFATGAAAQLAPSLNVADRLRVLKGLRQEYPDQPLFAILDDRLPPELDHFKIRRAPFDSRLLRISDKPAPETFRDPIESTISAAEDAFPQIDIVGLDIMGLDGGVSRAFPNPLPVESQVVNGLIQRGEFIEVAVTVLKTQAGQYFAEFAFVDGQLRIPTAQGFAASKSMEIGPEDLQVGIYLRDRFVIKIPGFIPPGLHTLAVSIDAVLSEQAGTYKGKSVKRMSPLASTRPWMGQTRYQPLARVWVQ